MQSTPSVELKTLRRYWSVFLFFSSFQGSERESAHPMSQLFAWRVELASCLRRSRVLVEAPAQSAHAPSRPEWRDGRERYRARDRGRRSFHLQISRWSYSCHVISALIFKRSLISDTLSKRPHHKILALVCRHCFPLSSIRDIFSAQFAKLSLAAQDVPQSGSPAAVQVPI